MGVHCRPACTFDVRVQQNQTFSRCGSNSGGGGFEGKLGTVVRPSFLKPTPNIHLLFFGFYIPSLLSVNKVYK